VSDGRWQDRVPPIYLVNLCEAIIAGKFSEITEMCHRANFERHSRPKE
jgi:hypothetical protein